MNPPQNTVLAVRDIVTRFGTHAVHQGISFSVQRGSLVGMIGASGTGKSVLLREIIGLHRPSSGQVELLGCEMWDETGSPAHAARLAAVRRRFGMMFQDGALFSSLTVAQNVAVALREHTTLDDSLIDELVQLRLHQAGLPAEAAHKLPSELSGGMRKRAAIARAIALEPELLFMDEPTSGLDPITARGFDRLVRSLVDDLGLTVFLVTHDLDTLIGATDRVIALAEGRVLADAPVQDLMRSQDPWLSQYFLGRTPPAAHIKGEPSYGS